MKKWAYSKYKNSQNEDSLIHLKLYSEKHLTDDFTDRVMNQIHMTEILPASVTKTAGLAGIHRSRNRKRVLHWGSTTLAIGTLAALIFLIKPSVLDTSLSSPPKTLLILSNEWEELHLLDAKKLGVIQQPNIAISDQGYTLTLQEVVADPTRMVINVRITDSTGKPVEDAMSMFDTGQLKITNEVGQVIGKGPSVIPWESKTATGEYNQEYLLLSYTFPVEQPGDTVLIQGNVHELVTDFKKGKSVSGDWSFSYEADMTKAHKLSVTTELEETYTTPDGLNIEMERLVHTPAGARLEFNTFLTDKAAARTPEELKNDLGVMYHFEDENGKEISIINSSLDGVYKKITTAQDGKLHWTYYFTNLPYDSEQLRFVLDGYFIPVQSNDSFTFRPKDLIKNPAVFKAQGDVLNLNNMKITETSYEPGTSAWIPISGKFINKFGKDVWIARDAQGKEYKVKRWGSYSDGENVIFGETGEHSNKVYLIVKDLNTMPEKLTLIRTLTDKKYTNVNWSFDLPRIERNKALQ